MLRCRLPQRRWFNVAYRQNLKKVLQRRLDNGGKELNKVLDELRILEESIESTASLLTDPDPQLRQLAQSEHSELTASLNTLYRSTLPSRLYSDQTGGRNDEPEGALIELKAGVGGLESSLFVGELMRMYMRYSSFHNSDLPPSLRWSSEVVSKSENDSGGFREILLQIRGRQAYDKFRFESGVHRVQRVPETEEKGRVHTSTVSVIVLPLLPEREAAPLFEDKDLKIETMRARGAGGQHVNKTESAVRITHIPSGIVISCQDERSQHQNKRLAFQILSTRLAALNQSALVSQKRATKNALVSSVDRSEKIRTYNFPQERVTDHRLSAEGKGWKVSTVLEGEEHFARLLDRLAEVDIEKRVAAEANETQKKVVN